MFCAGLVFAPVVRSWLSASALGRLRARTGAQGERPAEAKGRMDLHMGALPCRANLCSHRIGDLLWTATDGDIRTRAGAISLIGEGYFTLAARDQPTFDAIVAALDIAEDDWHFLAPRDD